MARALGLLFLCPTLVLANPYPDPRAVPIDPPDHTVYKRLPLIPSRQLCREGQDVVRVEVGWTSEGEKYQLTSAVIERSGTDALLKRSQHEDPYGSYQGTLTDPFTGSVLAYDAIGTGQEFRKLTRMITFRFPRPSATVLFHLRAEDPVSGQLVEVLKAIIDPHALQRVGPCYGKRTRGVRGVDVREVQAATQSPSLILTIYADGYKADNKDQFWKDAQRTVNALKDKGFPMFEHLDFRAAFAPSNQELGSAQNLGMPVAERDSFLGLYYPYWNPFGRWYNVVYPTREERYRAGVGQVPYDYPIVLIDNNEYWGIGNFNELTAIPASHSSFTYLLTHEFGHYFGLNEEYEGGGMTELAFSPKVTEPWSQNITFSTDPASIKWKEFIPSGTPVPTPRDNWTGDGPYGVYEGGYADTEPLNRSHKPGFACVMESGSHYCPICRKAIERKIQFDLGQGR